MNAALSTRAIRNPGPLNVAARREQYASELSAAVKDSVALLDPTGAPFAPTGSPFQAKVEVELADFRRRYSAKAKVAAVAPMAVGVLIASATTAATFSLSALSAVAMPAIGFAVGGALGGVPMLRVFDALSGGDGLASGPPTGALILVTGMASGLMAVATASAGGVDLALGLLATTGVGVAAGLVAKKCLSSLQR